MLVKSAVLAAAVAMAGLSAQAQSLRGDQGPREFPPASYKGKQYVDSAGCAYIRAGIDGNVTWVPRVARDRRVLCGFQPSLGPDELRAAGSDAPAAKEPVRITLDAPAAEAPAATVKPPVRAAAPAPAKPVAGKAAKPRIAAAAPQPAVPAARAVQGRQSACPGASPLSSLYINSGERYPVRCGPQGTPVTGAAAQAAGTKVVIGADGASVPLAPGARVLPAHVWAKRQQNGDLRVPKGYKSVWEDDRLNPRRAEQTVGGIAQTRLIWTDTVPRRLIDKPTGRDVTAEVPLVYPYTDTVTQRRELGEVKLMRRDGQLVKRIRRNRGVPPVLSSRSGAQAALPAAATGRYVQVGVYAQEANAKATARRMQALGLPVAMKTQNRGGTTLRTLVVGPFSQSAQLGAALGAVRNAGYGDAFAVR